MSRLSQFVVRRYEFAVATAMLLKEAHPFVCMACKGKGREDGAFAGWRRCRECSGLGFTGTGSQTRALVMETFGDGRPL
jgi:DnaJ-class molecular chaperone